MSPQQNMVRFNGRDEVFPIMNRYDYTVEEKAETWMTGKDLKLIKEDMKGTILLLLNGDKNANLTSDDHCTRGLECFTPENVAAKKRAKYEARKAIFNEQYLQYALDGCIHNPERLADGYRKVTEPSRVAARVTGIVDAECVWSGGALLGFPLRPLKLEMARSETFIEDQNDVRRLSLVSYSSRAA